MDVNRFLVNPAGGMADEGVLKALRCDGRRKAVLGSFPPGETADSAIGVTPAAMGVRPPSPAAKNLAFFPWSPNEVMSFRADDLARLRCGPRLTPGGDKGGLKISGMLSFRLWKVTCAADGDVHGSVDSTPVQAKLQRSLDATLIHTPILRTYHRMASCCWPCWTANSPHFLMTWDCRSQTLGKKRQSRIRASMYFLCEM